MRDVIKLVLLSVPLAILVGWSWAFVLPYYWERDVLGIIVLGTIWAVGVTIASGWIIRRQYRAVRSGLPLNDERSRMIAVRAGYFSFLVSIAWWMILSAVVISDTRAFGVPAHEQAAEALVGGLLALPAIFFIVWALLTVTSRPVAR